METYDLMIIGGGPAGYVAAIRAAQLGASVCLVEKNNPGGTCLNAGCIPTKALLHVSSLYSAIQGSQKFGISAGTPAVDWSRVQQYKSGVVRRLSSGVEYLLHKNRVQFLKGEARFLDQNRVEVSSPGGPVLGAGRSFLICTGARSSAPRIEGLESDMDGVYDSTGILEIDRIPASLAVIGGGVIGLEVARIFLVLGTQVTVVDALPRVLPDFDPELVDAALELLKKKGLEAHLESRVLSIASASRGEGDKILVCADPGGHSFSFSAEAVLIAAGRKPFSGGLNLEAAGVKTKDGAVVVNEYLQSSVSHIYAAGDVIGKYLYAHAASEEGTLAAENALGARRKINYRNMPRAVFLEPQLASVGMTENEAVKQGFKVKTGRFPLQGNGKCVITGAEEGLAKFVAEDLTGEILGLHLLTPSAADLIGAGSLAMSMEATLDELAFTPFIHPSVSEALKEGALAALGRPVNI